MLSMPRCSPWQKNSGNATGKDTILCRELLGLEKAEGTPVAEERTPEYYQRRPCPMLVRVAADIMAEYMQAHPLPRTSEQSAGETEDA